MKIKLNIVALGSILRNKVECLNRGEQYYFAMNTWATGYHHWIAEVAPKFLLFEDELRNGKVLMPKNRPKFISEFLEMFNFTNLVEIEANAFVEELNVISNPNSGHFDATHISQLRTKVLNRVGAESGWAKRKLYVSRSRAASRKVINESEVISYLQSIGFEIVNLEELSFAEQVQLFVEVEMLVSVHGAGLTNAIFMPPGGTVIELYPQIRNRERELNACYERLSGVLGQTHEFVFSRRVQKGKKADFHVDDIIVEIAALKRIMSKWHIS